MKISIDGVPVAFDSAGEGPAVLLLHAFPLSKAMWTAQAAALKHRYQVIRMDARGFGDSAPGDTPLTMDLIADDAAAVLDHLRVREAVLCGCSMGGYAAFAFAARFPARVRGLVLVDTRAADDTEDARAGRATLAQKALAEGAPIVAETMLPKLLGPTSHRERPEVVDRVRRWILSAPPQAVAHALYGLGARPDRRPLLREIDAPTLLVRGEEDAISTAADLAEMQQGIRGSEAVTLPRAGHLPILEVPEAFGQVLENFLARLHS
jgi:pimeloyl-ACP methyl ester carboxylesterase